MEKLNDFEDKKRAYFSSLGLKVFEAFRLHKAFGLFGRNQAGQKEWRNVSEHCLVETARVSVFGRLFELSPKTQHNLMVAAAMHDFHKKHQMQKTPQGSSLTLEDYKQSEHEAEEELIKAGIAPDIIRYVGSVGSLPDNLNEIKTILSKGGELSEVDLAFLVMHYVDDYTIDAGWSAQTDTLPDGRKVNDLNRRIEKARQNPKYQKIGEEQKTYFHETKFFEIQEGVGESIERYLAARITEKTGLEIDPKDLPTFIDDQIKKQIG